MPISAHFIRRAIFTRKVGQTDLVFGVRSGFISRSVHARLQVSVCSGYDLYPRGWPNIGLLAFWPLWLRKVGQTGGGANLAIGASMSVAHTIQMWWPQVSNLQR